MATIKKKGGKKPKVKPRATAKKFLPQKPAQTVQSLRCELADALEQQTATSEILRAIASAPTNIQSVLNVVAENAARLCEASSAQVFRFDGNIMRLAANYGELAASEERPVSRATVTGRAIVDRKTIHVHDLDESATEFPESKAARHQARLATPLLRAGVALGVIGIRRTDLRPFTKGQVKLLETFADQAVIAIENARLFQEREAGNRDLAALHDVTAAASQSLEIKPVLDKVVRKITEIFNFDSVSIYLFD